MQQRLPDVQELKAREEAEVGIDGVEDARLDASLQPRRLARHFGAATELGKPERFALPQSPAIKGRFMLQYLGAAKPGLGLRL